MGVPKDMEYAGDEYSYNDLTYQLIVSYRGLNDQYRVLDLPERGEYFNHPDDMDSAGKFFSVSVSVRQNTIDVLLTKEDDDEKRYLKLSVFDAATDHWRDMQSV